MRLTEIIQVRNIKIPLIADTKAGAISELVQLLAANGQVSDAKKVLDSVLERENTRTTGIGNGLAIPHGKSTGVSGLVMAIGKPATPIDFQSIDGKPVSIIWMLTSPPEKTGPHIHALARVTKLMMNDKFRMQLNGVTSAEEFFDAVIKQEATLV